MSAVRRNSIIVAMGLMPIISWALPFEIVKDNTDQSQVSHTITSGSGAGAVTLGISDQGGGYINQLTLPGKGDVMGSASDAYGRGGQSAIRDYRHGKRYNPTQAGFTDTAGTVCPIAVTPGGTLVVLQRKCCLWRGDGEFDFTQYENLADDGYDESQNPGGMPDVDDFNDIASGQQATEITSEFDYYGTYSDMKGKVGIDFSGNDTITIPCFRHYFEYTYARSPGACLSQHNKGPKYDPLVHVDDISSNMPNTLIAASQSDMGVLKCSWSLRMDRSIWAPTYRWWVEGVTLKCASRGTTAKWFETYRNSGLQNRISGVEGNPLYTPNPFNPQPVASPLIILSDFSTEEGGPAIGLFFPPSVINKRTLVGDNDTGGADYVDDRRVLTQIVDSPYRVSAMQLFGFEQYSLGMLNPTRTLGFHEKYRSEFYILYGTPGEIYRNARRICTF